ncbi:MAG: DUF6916 family protein [Thermoanaerobaculia bacterium]
MLQDLTPASFEAQLGTVFHIHSGDAGPLGVKLHEVKRHERHPGPRSEPFSVYFLGALRPILLQGIYRVEHAAMGTMEIFLVPVGPDPKGQGMVYEAVFN